MISLTQPDDAKVQTAVTERKRSLEQETQEYSPAKKSCLRRTEIAGLSLASAGKSTDQNSIKLLDRHDEILAIIFSTIPEDLKSLRQVNQQFKKLLSQDNQTFFAIFSQLVLEQLKAELSEERYSVHQEIAKRRLKAKGEDPNNSFSILKKLFAFQRERYPQNIEDNTKPGSIDGYIKREKVIKQFNKFIVAKRLSNTDGSLPNKMTEEQLNKELASIEKQLQSPKTIDLKNLGLTELPEGIFALYSNAQVIDASKNSISFIPHNSFLGLPNLEELRLEYNQITVIPKGISSELTNLRVLRLHHNHIAAVMENAFLGLNNLQLLELGCNRIAVIQDCAFFGLENLQRLWLNHNLIETISKGTFLGLKNLKELWLYYNRIAVIQEGTFLGLKNLQTLFLNDKNYKDCLKRHFLMHPSFARS